MLTDDNIRAIRDLTEDDRRLIIDEIASDLFPQGLCKMGSTALPKTPESIPLFA